MGLWDLILGENKTTIKKRFVFLKTFRDNFLDLLISVILLFFCGEKKKHLQGRHRFEGVILLPMIFKLVFCFMHTAWWHQIIQISDLTIKSIITFFSSSCCSFLNLFKQTLRLLQDVK